MSFLADIRCGQNLVRINHFWFACIIPFVRSTRIWLQVSVGHNANGPTACETRNTTQTAKQLAGASNLFCRLRARAPNGGAECQSLRRDSHLFGVESTDREILSLQAVEVKRSAGDVVRPFDLCRAVGCTAGLDYRQWSNRGATYRHYRGLTRHNNRWGRRYIYVVKSFWRVLYEAVVFRGAVRSYKPRSVFTEVGAHTLHDELWAPCLGVGIDF